MSRMVPAFRDFLKTLEEPRWMSLAGEASAQARIRTAKQWQQKTGTAG